MRAQRLAASMESSPQAYGRGPCPQMVLNALRHQWNPHVCWTQRLGHAPMVLNALRHQWNPHNLVYINFFNSYMCSTPCGINGILTRLCVYLISGAVVSKDLVA